MPKLIKMACRKLICNNLNKINSVSVRSISPFSNKFDADNDLTAVTHTGQVFDKSDYRNVRFTNFTRYVNPQHAIKLIDDIPIKECEARVVYCDGGGGPLGHPKVYINLDKPGAHSCTYCGLRFQKKDDHHH